MSELDIQRRKEYKENRKKWIMVQIVAIVLLAAIALGSFLIYNRMNRTYYIEYTENGSVNYKVQYYENNFFDSEWIEKDQTYISSLIKGMSAEFIYLLNTDSADLAFNYQYKIDAKILIASKDSGVPYYTYEENIFPLIEPPATSSTSVKINETVAIDYVKYNRIANTFVETYNLKNSASCTLVVTLDVEILSSNKQFDKENKNKYTISMNVPLIMDSFNVYTSSSSPANEVKILEYEDIVDKNIFYNTSIVALTLDALLTLALVVFLHLTRNEDITYAAKINKILRSYSAFIQRMDGEFNYDGYQIITIKTFNEMLGIRDTIQSPVLMSENHDETMTRFLIPTNTNLLYVFEIKVDNYDEIYGKEETEDVEVVILEENVDQELIAEAMAQPDIKLSEIEIAPYDQEKFEVTAEEPGVEVIGVVWPEREKSNKVYRYDPNGETLEKGDIVLAPTFDDAKNRDVIRKVAVSHENHRVDPEQIKHPLKKIVAVVKKHVAHSLTPNANKSEASENNENEQA